jgi:hypothetical protein
MPRRFVLGLLLGGLVGRQGHDEGVAWGCVRVELGVGDCLRFLRLLVTPFLTR